MAETCWAWHTMGRTCVLDVFHEGDHLSRLPGLATVTWDYDATRYDPRAPHHRDAPQGSQAAVDVVGDSDV